MQKYLSKNKESVIRSLDIDSKSGICTFTLSGDSDPAALNAHLSHRYALTFLGTHAAAGKDTVLVFHSQNPQALPGALKAKGESLEIVVPEKKFNFWKWRGITSFIGQSLQLLSSFKSNKVGEQLQTKDLSDQVAIAGFATSNLIANISNITFGSQKKEDFHQLHHLKSKFNENFGKYLPDATPLPADQKLAASRKEEKLSLGKRAFNLAQKYSVSGGEIGLRVFGSSQLSYPVTRVPTAITKYKETGSVKDALVEARNTNTTTFKVGLMMLLGKAVSFISKEPDPFNPKPASLLDRFREKITFRLSSVIEGSAAAYMAWDRFTNHEMKLFGKKLNRDYAGFVGNLVFIGGYAIRLFAPYGSREVNMKELNAHISDSVALMKPVLIPHVLTEVAYGLDQHFGKKSPGVSELYSGLVADLKTQHNIDVVALSSRARIEATPQADMVAGKAATLSVDKKPEQIDREKFRRNKTYIPTTHHRERALTHAEAAIAAR